MVVYFRASDRAIRHGVRSENFFDTLQFKRNRAEMEIQNPSTMDAMSSGLVEAMETGGTARNIEQDLPADGLDSLAVGIKSARKACTAID